MKSFLACALLLISMSSFADNPVSCVDQCRSHDSQTGQCAVNLVGFCGENPLCTKPNPFCVERDYWTGECTSYNTAGDDCVDFKVEPSL